MPRSYEEEPRRDEWAGGGDYSEGYNAYDDSEEYDDAYDDAYDDDYDDDDDWEEDLPPEEKKLRAAGRFKVAAGFFDFAAVIFGLVVVLIMIALILSLVNWVVSDLGRTFNFLTT